VRRYVASCTKRHQAEMGIGVRRKQLADFLMSLDPLCDMGGPILQ
jgi:hypothetical protein